MKHAIKTLSLVVIIGLTIFSSCSEDDPSTVSIVTATVTGTNLATGSSATVDLNTVTAPTNVPPDGVFTITFSKAIDATTANTTSVTLAQGTTNIPVSVTVTGSDVTITPTNNLVRGTLHTLSISGAIKASDGGVSVASTRTFTTAGTAPAVVPKADKLVVYLPFNSVVKDELNHTILNDNVTLGTDRFGNVESAATFNGTTNYVGVQYAADMSNASTTVSYWMKLPASADYAAHIGQRPQETLNNMSHFPLAVTMEHTMSSTDLHVVI
ncbi:MAG: Ig-like domain-containing protein [Bacteroidota bacterium]|nr:Ig-like domain-containing protein [Bacteroidota bacterium]